MIEAMSKSQHSDKLQHLRELKSKAKLGGVDTNELSSRTMEAKNVPGLYIIGEVVDVTGHPGGYNFQWAWASGFVAGQSL